MIANSPAAVTDAFSSSSRPTSADRRCAAIPEPITTAASSALPSSSAVSRRHRSPGNPASVRLIEIDVASIEFQIDHCQWESCMPEARATITLPVISEALCGPPITEVPLSEADSATLAAVFAALGDPVRLRLLSMVAAQGEVCSCHLQ